MLLCTKGEAVPGLVEFWGEVPISMVCVSTVCSALHIHPQLLPKETLSLVTKEIFTQGRESSPSYKPVGAGAGVELKVELIIGVILLFC